MFIYLATGLKKKIRQKILNAHVHLDTGGKCWLCWSLMYHFMLRPDIVKAGTTTNARVKPKYQKCPILK